MIPAIILSSILVLSAACSDGEDGRKKSSGSSSSLQSKAPQPLSWQDSLKAQIPDPLEFQLEGSILTLTVRNGKPLTRSEFGGLMRSVALELDRSRAPVTSVLVEAAGVDQSLFKGRFYVADIAVFARGEISEPELARRIEVEEVETLDSLKRKAKVARQEGRLADAEEILKKWVRMEPMSPLSLSLLGNVLRDEKKYWDAIEIYKSLLNLNPDLLFVYHNLGYAYERVGALTESATAYQQALQLKPDDLQLMLQLAEVHRKNGDANGTLVWLGKAKAIHENAEAWLIEGNLQRDLKKYALARTAYAKAQKLAPADQRIFYNLILVDLDTKNFGEARKKFKELQTKDPALAAELAGLPVFQEEVL